MIPFLDLKQLHDRHEAAIEAATGVLRSGWYLLGDETRRFEEEYARYIGTRHCIGCGNGLDALTLILRAYIQLGRLHEGDEVIVPANTFIATVLAVTENRLTPVFVEPSPETLQIDGYQLEQAISPRTRALMLVHLYGCCAYTPHIADLCRRHHLLLIEDNAQAHGCLFPPPSGGAERNRSSACDDGRFISPKECRRLWRGAHTGSLGDAAAHSFYPTKNLGAMGDAGAVTTDDDQLAQMVRSLGNYGSTEKYHYPCLGRNSRIDEVQTAILRTLLPGLDAGNERRRQIAGLYLRHIHHPAVRMLRTDRDCVWHIFPVFCQERDRLQQHLREQGIGTQIHYPVPPHRQPCYRSWNHLSLPVTEQLAAEELSLPCNPYMTDEEAMEVAAAVNNFKA